MTPQAPSLWKYILEPCTETVKNLEAVDWEFIPYTWLCDPNDHDGMCDYGGTPSACETCSTGGRCSNGMSCPSSGKCNCNAPMAPGGGGACPSNGICTNAGYIDPDCPSAPDPAHPRDAMVECKGTIQGPKAADMKQVGDTMTKFCTSMADLGTPSADKPEL